MCEICEIFNIISFLNKFFSEFHYQDAKEKSIQVAEASKPDKAATTTAEAEKGKYQRAEKSAKEIEEEERQLKMGKGKIPDKKDDDENVKLKPIPEKQVIKFNCSFYF